MAESQIIKTIETTYSINYETKNPVPISEIISALKGAEDLILRTPRFIEAAFDGVHVFNVEVRVDSLQSGSLKSSYLIKYMIGSDNAEKLDGLIEDIMSDSTLGKVVIVGMAAMVGYGVSAVISQNSPKKHIEAYNNTIINIGGETRLEADEIKAILDGFTDKKTLAKNAVNVIRPAKPDPLATIEFNGLDELNIPKEAIQEMPEEYEPPKPIEKQEKYRNRPIVIFASDQDKLTTNWGGIIPQLADKRIKFELADAINPKNLHGRKNVNADLILFSTLNVSTGDYKPVKAIITKTE